MVLQSCNVLARLLISRFFLRLSFASKGSFLGILLCNKDKMDDTQADTIQAFYLDVNWTISQRGSTIFDQRAHNNAIARTEDDFMTRRTLHICYWIIILWKTKSYHTKEYSLEIYIGKIVATLSQMLPIITKMITFFQKHAKKQTKYPRMEE